MKKKKNLPRLGFEPSPSGLRFGALDHSATLPYLKYIQVFLFIFQTFTCKNPVQSLYSEIPVQSLYMKIPVQSLYREIPVQSLYKEIPVQSLYREIPVSITGKSL